MTVTESLSKVGQREARLLRIAFYEAAKDTAPRFAHWADDLLLAHIDGEAARVDSLVVGFVGWPKADLRAAGAFLDQATGIIDASLGEPALAFLRRLRGLVECMK